MNITLNTTALENAKNISEINTEMDNLVGSLLALKEEVEQALADVKTVVTSKMLELDPKIKTLKTDNLRFTITRRKTSYVVNEETNPEFVLSEIKLVPNLVAIENFISEFAMLPSKVEAKEGGTSLTIAKINKAK